ncbi:MAG: alpha/beta hydrolase, partial [Bacteroidales bacterium]
MDIKKNLLPCLVTFSIICSAQEKESREISMPEGIEFIQDINYAGTNNPVQVLDIVIPENRSSEKLPAIVYIHGGGWLGGDKGNSIKTLKPFIKDGDYIGIAINYRLSDEAKWPAQIHDCKAAIRWIKGNAEKYG